MTVRSRRGAEQRGVWTAATTIALALAAVSPVAFAQRSSSTMVNAPPASSASPRPAPSTSPDDDADAAAASAAAATNGSGTSPQTAAPVAAGSSSEAPAPLEAPPPLTPEQQRLLRPAGAEFSDADVSGTHRFVLPPYLEEHGRGHHLRVFFPFYFDSRVDQDHRLVLPPYYRVRTPTTTGDVFFPLYFRFRTNEAGAHASTDILPPFWYFTRRGPDRGRAMSIGIAPLFGYNEDFGENGRLRNEHLLIPALLTYHQWTPDEVLTVVGPVVYWRQRRETNWAVAPFIFHHHQVQSSWTLIPPLLTYHTENYDTNHRFTLVGPFFTETGPSFTSYNLAPLFFYQREGNRSRVTVLPLFHTESGPDHFGLITPLGGYWRDHDESTVILPFYQNHRGLTDVDAVAPLFFYARTPRLGSSTFGSLLGFYARSQTGFSWGVFPFAARFREYGRHDTIATPLFVHSSVESTNSSVTWVFPTLHTESNPSTHFFNIYPLLWTAGGRTWHHTVLFPFYWDVTSQDSGQQINVVFPLHVRVASRTHVTQWTFPNYVYWEDHHEDGTERSYGWDVFPFVQAGQPHPGDEYWSVLEGLVGHRRQGSYEQTEIFWLWLGATQRTGTPTASPSPAPQARRRVQPNGDVLLDL